VGAVVLVTVGIGACHGDSMTASEDVRTPANAMITGAYDVRATSAQQHEGQHAGGALMFDVARADLDSVTSTTGTVFTIDRSASNELGVTVRVVYAGHVGDDVIATLWTRGGQVPLLTVQQAAEEGTLATRAPSEFTLTAIARAR